MFTRILTTASVAALLCVAPAYAQEQAEQPVIKKPAAGSEQGGAAATQPKEGNADGGQAMPDSGGNAAQGDAQQNTTGEAAQGDQQNAEQPVKKKGENAETDQTGAEQQNQNAETEQTGTKKKQDQNAETNQTDTKNKAGDSASAGKVKEITTEKKTVIKEKIVTKNVTKIDRSEINFNISVGVSVPATIVLNPVPVEIVEIVPEYRGYLFFVLDDGTIVIVEPGSLQIVTVIV